MEAKTEKVKQQPEGATDLSFVIADAIIKQVLVPHFKLGSDAAYEVKTSMTPIISNAIFRNQNELLENERIRTFTELAKALPAEQVYLAIKALGYKITI